MTRHLLFLCPLLLTAISLCAMPALAIAEIRVGVAAVDITPPEGSPMAGYYSARGCTGVHDPLHATAMVIEQGDQRAALVALDLITTTTELVEEVRRVVTASTGIPTDAIMISASHTHTGPSIRTTGRDAEAMQNGSTEVRHYLQSLPSRIASAVEAAANQMTTARLTTATATAPNVAFNRRFHMTDGTVGWNPPKQSDRIVRPAGPVDEEVQVVVVRSLEDAPLAVYMNFAMHLDTVGGTQASADYPGPAAELLRRALGEDLQVLFTIGCAGDINHRDVQWGNRQKGVSEATRIGTHVASAALHAIRHAEPIEEGPIGFARQIVELRSAPHARDEVQWATEANERKQAGEKVPFLDQVRAGRISDVEALDGGPVLAEVQVITLGDDLAWVGLPGEIFVELGMAIKKASPYKQTLIAELSGGSVGYVPTRAAYAQGNYEVISARVGEGSGERLAEVALDLLGQLHNQ